MTIPKAGRPVVVAASPGGHLTQLLLLTRLVKPKVLITYDDNREFEESSEFMARCFYSEHQI